MILLGIMWWTIIFLMALCLCVLAYGMGMEKGRIKAHFGLWAQSYCAVKPCSGFEIVRSFTELLKDGKAVGPLTAQKWLAELVRDEVLSYEATEEGELFRTTGKRVWEPSPKTKS